MLYKGPGVANLTADYYILIEGIIQVPGKYRESNVKIQNI